MARWSISRAMAERVIERAAKSFQASLQNDLRIDATRALREACKAEGAARPDSAMMAVLREIGSEHPTLTVELACEQIESNRRLRDATRMLLAGLSSLADEAGLKLVRTDQIEQEE